LTDNRVIDVALE